MTTPTVIFITVLICFELDFFTALYCKEIGEWLRSKSEELRARADSMRNANSAYNAGYTDGKIDVMKTFMVEEEIRTRCLMRVCLLGIRLRTAV